MLYDQIKAERIKAMKNKDAIRKSILTTLLGEVETNAKRENTDATDELVIAMCKKFIKSNGEVLTKAVASRQLFNQLNTENIILSEFLPKQLTEAELRVIITELNATNIGQVMQHLNKNHNGQFNRGLAASLAKELL